MGSSISILLRLQDLEDEHLSDGENLVKCAKIESGFGMRVQEGGPNTRVRRVLPSQYH